MGDGREGGGGGAGAPCAIRRIEDNAFLEFAILSLLFKTILAYYNH